MTKKLRLLINTKALLFAQVKNKLATESEMKKLRYLDDRIRKIEKRESN